MPLDTKHDSIAVKIKSALIIYQRNSSSGKISIQVNILDIFTNDEITGVYRFLFIIIYIAKSNTGKNGRFFKKMTMTLEDR